MFRTLKENHKGLYYALITSVISGVSIFINKFAVSEVTPPLYFTSIKNIVVGIFIVSIVLSVGKWKELRKLSKKDIRNLLLIGLVGGSIPFYLYFEGLSKISAINGAIIHKSLVIWVALLAIPFLKEKMSKLQALAVFALFGSNFFVGGFSGFEFSRGEMLVLLATVFWSVENILSKKILSKIDTDIVVLFRMGFGSLNLMVATFISVPETIVKTLTLSYQQIFWILITAVLLFGYVSNWYKALKFSSAIFVTSVLVSSTLITNILSAIFITHSWNLPLTMQAVFIAFGITTFIFLEKRRNLEVFLSQEFN